MIKLKNINHLILKNINLEIKKNEMIILKGISGSGKSTLLSIIGSFLKPTNGYIEVDGEQISKLNDIYLSLFRSKTIGFVFQNFNLFENLSVYENLLASTLPYGDDITQANKKINLALEKSNILHKKNTNISILSGGEKQRVSFARAIINDPKILLLDEPTASLDKKNSQQLIEFLKNSKKSGKTIVIATHDLLFENLDFIDKIIGIDDGQLLY